MNRGGQDVGGLKRDYGAAGQVALAHLLQQCGHFTPISCFWTCGRTFEGFGQAKDLLQVLPRSPDSCPAP